MAKKKIYVVATAHLDTVWCWDLEETIDKYILKTLKDNFKLFEKYPNYTFSFEGSYRYELMEEYYPELFKKMSDYIKEGRWRVCGSAYENGDVNVPSPEALIRNILIGNSYFKKKFGITSKDVYLPDCFGFGKALPSVARHCNLLGFTTQKLAWGSAFGTPFDIGYWVGADGEKILANINPHSYSYTLKKLRNWGFVLDKLKEDEKYGLDMTYIFHGVGDRGGAPAERSVRFVENEEKKNGESDIEVHQAYADEIFRDVENNFTREQKDRLPVWDNELVMQNHGVGGYTSRCVGKRWNRRCEELADTAERSSVIADYLGVRSYDRQGLTTAWKRFIAHQFHDDLPGTSCQRVYKRSWNDYALSMNQFKNEYESSVGAYSNLLNSSRCEGRAICVFNSMEFPRKSCVEFTLENVKSDFVRVFDSDSNEIKSQSQRLPDGKLKVVMVADVGPMGTKVYDVRESPEPCALESALEITENSLSNEKYDVKLNKNGDIASIVDKSAGGRQLLKKPITLGLYRYSGSANWPAWEMNYAEANKNEDYVPKFVKSEILENGKARVALKVTQKFENSVFSFVYALSSGGEIVEVYSQIEWRSLKMLAKHKFSLTASNDVATFDLGLGAIERKNMNEKLFEVPAQKWVDLTDRDGSFGVSILSECKYGWDKFDDNTLRLTAIHTPRKNYKIDSMQSFMDLGLNRYSFAVFSHNGKLGAQTQKAARGFVTPASAFELPKHAGILGSEYNFIQTSSDDVLVRAVKMAEDSDKIVVRLNEGANRTVENYTLTLGEGIESAEEIYGSEEPRGPAEVSDSKLVCSFKPYEIKSFLLTLKKPDFVKKTELCAPLETEYNRKIITKQNEKGDFPYNIPYEIASDSIRSCGGIFELHKDGANAFTADGRKIGIDSDVKSVLALCAAARDDKTVEFKLDDAPLKKKIYSMTERFARWDLYDFGETAYIKDANLGYEATHCHDPNGKDVTAKQLCFYVVRIDTRGAKTLTFPVDGEMIILSLSKVLSDNAVLVSDVYDRIENNRPFTFRLTNKEQKEYKKLKRYKYLNDKDGFKRDDGRGKDY